MATHEGIFPTFFLSGFECSTFDWRDRGRRNPGRGDAPRRARGRGLRVVPRSGHRRRARGDSVAARRARRTLRLLAARAVHRGYEPPSDPSHLGPLPLRLPRRCRPVRAGFWRALRRLRPSGGGIRGTPGAGTAFLHADQRDHLLRLHGGRSGVGRLPSGTPKRTGTFRLSLCAADIAAVKAIREVDPGPAWSISIRSSSWYRPRIDRIWPTRRRTRPRGHLLRLGRDRRPAPPGARRRAGDPRYRRRQLLLVRPDGVPRAGTARRPAARRPPHQTAG